MEAAPLRAVSSFKTIHSVVDPDYNWMRIAEPLCLLFSPGLSDGHAPKAQLCNVFLLKA